MNDPKRAEIKARIAAAQAREAERENQTLTERASETASEASDAFTSFVREHPLAAAAGGVVLGIIVAGMFKGPRQAAARGGAKAMGLAAIGAEIASGFASELFDDAEDIGRAGKRRAVDLGDAVGDKARSLRRDANYRASAAGDAAFIAKRDAGKAIARALARR